MKTVSLTINGREITANKGGKLLWVALDNDIYIPNLCAIRNNLHPLSACRLCFVEVEGREQPVCACTEEVVEGMIVNTRGEKALKLIRTGFELIMASHSIGCAHCINNGSCELQKIAKFLGIKLKTNRFRLIIQDLPVDDSNPVLTYDPNKCVLCGRCIWVCNDKLGNGILGFINRGFQRIVSLSSDEESIQNKCQGCGECVKVCPTGALSLKRVISEQDYLI
ncbi:MAG: 2Fe-2S iron-sulfur cluster-binding protein [Dehalococcoidales bacterium]|nr:2Fe-2S iron-sulfur cluster-binding protein [Dehalococcoidales bacterium]